MRVEGIYGLGCSVCLAAAIQLCGKGPQYVNIIYSQTKAEYDHYEDPRDQLHRMEVVVRICRRALKGLGFAGCALNKSISLTAMQAWIYIVVRASQDILRASCAS